MIKRLVIAVVLLALVGGGLVGFNLFRDRMIEQAFSNRTPPPVTVEIATAEPVVWRPVIEAIGTVYASRGVDLTVETAGVVEAIRFVSNARVTAGEVLVELENSVQRADLQAAEAQLAFDRLTLERTRELSTRGVTANTTLEGSEAAARVSEAQVARAAAVLDQRALVAPFDGMIGLPRIDIGQYLSPGTVVATLQDIETMRVDFTLPEQRLPEIAMGQALRLRLADGGTDIGGTITGIDPRVDPESRLVSVRGEVANPDGLLAPGQFVRVAVDLPDEPGVLALPQTAVVSSLYGDFVYALRPRANGEGEEVRQVFVEPGRRAHGLVEVRTGLEPGERVVATGQNRLSGGQPVTPVEAGDDAGLAGSAPRREARLQ